MNKKQPTRDMQLSDVFSPVDDQLLDKRLPRFYIGTTAALSLGALVVMGVIAGASNGLLSLGILLTVLASAYAHTWDLIGGRLVQYVRLRRGSYE